MVGFELERHVPFPPEDIRFDWVELPSGPDEPHRVLIVAAERRTVERPLGLLAAAQRRPAAVVGGLPRAARAAGRERADRARGLGAPSRRRHRSALPRRPPAAHEPPRDGRDGRRSGAGDPAQPGAGSLDRLRGRLVVRRRRRGRDPPTWPRSGPPGLRAAHTPRTGLRSSPLCPRRTRARPCSRLRSRWARATPRSTCCPAEARPWTPSRAQLVTAGIVGVTALLGLSLALTHVLQDRALSRSVYRRRSAGSTRGQGGRAPGRRARPEAACPGRAAGRAGRAHPGPAGPARADRDAPRRAPGCRRLTLDRQGRRADRPGRRGERAHPRCSRPRSRLERVEFTSPGDQDAEQGAVPPPGGLGGSRPPRRALACRPLVAASVSSSEPAPPSRWSSAATSSSSSRS